MPVSKLQKVVQSSKLLSPSNRASNLSLAVASLNKNQSLIIKVQGARAVVGKRPNGQPYHYLDRVRSKVLTRLIVPGTYCAARGIKVKVSQNLRSGTITVTRL